MSWDDAILVRDDAEDKERQWKARHGIAQMRTRRTAKGSVFGGGPSARANSQQLQVRLQSTMVKIAQRQDQAEAQMNGMVNPNREKQIRGSGGSLEPPGPLLETPGPLLTHLHTIYIGYSECLPTRLNPLAERTCFSQNPNAPAHARVVRQDKAGRERAARQAEIKKRLDLLRARPMDPGAHTKYSDMTVYRCYHVHCVVAQRKMWHF